MDNFRNIRNVTFGIGGITAKRSKHQERPLLMICSFTNCWYPGTFIYPDYSTVQGGRTWQAFGGGKHGHETFRQARNYNFRDKCVVFARNLKFSNLTQ